MRLLHFALDFAVDGDIFVSECLTVENRLTLRTNELLTYSGVLHQFLQQKYCDAAIAKKLFFSLQNIFYNKIHK